MQVSQVIQASIQLGYPESAVPVIGIILLVCVVAYAAPRTSVLGERLRALVPLRR
jgi:hypothetical protein